MPPARKPPTRKAGKPEELAKFVREHSSDRESRKPDVEHRGSKTHPRYPKLGAPPEGAENP